ncbi:hypothetical protein BJ170DRAFT_679280 [Xylariales sp. AK1849]|nr:hypothetical protein BJ170DRAFT_679280 [Xylariales sp. AK1849]
MKYGDSFEAESVPRWSLHNVDYNSLKLQIKLHTAKDQATAITIPGQTNYALQRFENDFYQELYRQHDRVDLFVASKADEIHRRLKSLSGLINSLILRCTGPGRVTPRRQIKFAKYQQQVVDCGDDIRDLHRFVRAQVEALRKILKKYKKWTGSTTLTSRFNDNVIGNYKSFTKRDFYPLRQQYQDVLTTLRTSSPGIASPILRPESSNATIDRHLRDSQQSSRQPSLRTPEPIQPKIQPEIRGWNEYDNGSEAGDESYYIHINPEDSDGFPGMDTMRNLFGVPVEKLRSLFSRSSSKDAERQSLLNGTSRPQIDYFSVRPSSSTTDNDATEDEDTASSTDYPAYGYAAHYAALPSVEEQRMERFREAVLHRSLVLFYLVAIVLLVVAGVLVATGRHKLRLEVDAGVTLAVVASLFTGCMGLGAMLYRQDKLSVMYQLAVWMTFIATCMLNGMLLVLVVGSSNGL